MAPMIEVHKLSKEYRIGREQRHDETLREVIARAVKAPLKALRGSSEATDADGFHSFWALNDGEL